ncbi:MAG TPA: hypothetical protein VIG08_00055 [Gemmatimonadales bacterium]|jgi:hypothetical protein
MDVREIPVQVKGFGAPPTTAVIDVAVLSGADRLKRAVVMLGTGLVVALVALPIPLVHFILVPGALITGVGLAANRLTQSQIFQSAVGRCPFCGTEQTFPLIGRFRLPKSAHCVSCGRELTLEGESH